MRAQAQEVLAQAMSTGNQQLINQAQQIVAGIDHNEKLINAGANPQAHNQWQPRQGPQQQAPRNSLQPAFFGGGQ